MYLVIDLELLRQQAGTCRPDMVRERLAVVMGRVKASGRPFAMLRIR